jgi:hypothetical protein
LGLLGGESKKSPARVVQGGGRGTTAKQRKKKLDEGEKRGRETNAASTFGPSCSAIPGSSCVSFNICWPFY